jgi:hypothetical protein
LDAGLNAAHPRTSPPADSTNTLSPAATPLSTAATAPEKIHGWRRKTDASRPANKTRRGIAARRNARPDLELNAV